MTRVNFFAWLLAVLLAVAFADSALAQHAGLGCWEIVQEGACWHPDNPHGLGVECPDGLQSCPHAIVHNEMRDVCYPAQTTGKNWCEDGFLCRGGRCHLVVVECVTDGQGGYTCEPTEVVYKKFHHGQCIEGQDC
jgi:hypothetical protein